MGAVYRQWSLVTALGDAQGAIIGYLLIGTDNTARKLVEEALLRNEMLASAGTDGGKHRTRDQQSARSDDEITLYLARKTANVFAEALEYLEIADGELMRIAHITRQDSGVLSGVFRGNQQLGVRFDWLSRRSATGKDPGQRSQC